ncbi:O-antigen translocase [Flavimarina sp. Hel_I_48]|uniref:O-antigen translocase n=1 Tax=Flavimarina sp. Hel_I_48 TaxID=1392488 RepID=UPI00068F4616|nr:O-antigen translocase [Flavimarina sp. Hel_I_48]
MIKHLRQFIGGNVLLKITSFNAIAIGVRIVAGLISSKVIAFYLGAPGMALLGDLRNFMTSVQGVSTLGIYNGVVKYTSQYKRKPQLLGKVLTTSFLLGGIATILTALVLFFGASYWNTFLFGTDNNFTFIFEILGLALPFYGLNALLVAVINGFGKFKWIILINATTNILGLIITVFLIYTRNIEGAFIAVVTIPSVALLITAIALLKKRHFLRFFKFANFEIAFAKKLASYTGMALFSAMSTPLIFIAIRQHIINVDGLTHAGYWDAMLRLSDYYLMFVTTILTLYILPKLAETHTVKGFRREIFNFYKTILPLFGLGCILVFLLKKPLINLVFTEDFLAMSPIFAWQLGGDFLRVASMVLAYQFLAKNMFWTFIGTQVFSLAVIYFSFVFFIERYGFVGAGMGHLFSYFIYLVVVLILFRKALFSNRTEELI